MLKQIEQIVINCEELNNLANLDTTKILEFLGKNLNFPDYYGKNLDAFIDCFAEFGEQYAEKNIDVNVELVGLKAILAKPTAKLSEEKIQNLLGTLEEAAISRDETFADLGEFATKIIVK